MLVISRGMIGSILAFMIMLAISPPRAEAQETFDIDGLLQRTAKILADARSFSVHAEKMYDVVLLDGMKVQYSGALDIAVRRPDRMYVSFGDDLSSKELWYDGKTLTIQDHLANIHGIADAGPTIDATTDMLAEKYNLFLPLAELFSSDSYAQYAGSAGTRRYLGVHDVAGKPAHHLLIAGKRADWQIWIDAGEVPLPVKIVVTQIEFFGHPQQIILLSDWDLAAKLDDDVFEAEISAGSLLASFLVAEGGQ